MLAEVKIHRYGRIHTLRLSSSSRLGVTIFKSDTHIMAGCLRYESSSNFFDASEAESGRHELLTTSPLPLSYLPLRHPLNLLSFRQLVKANGLGLSHGHNAGLLCSYCRSHGETALPHPTNTARFPPTTLHLDLPPSSLCRNKP